MGDQERGAGASGPCRGLGQRPKTCAAAQPRKRCERPKAARNAARSTRIVFSIRPHHSLRCPRKYRRSVRCRAQPLYLLTPSGRFALRATARRADASLTACRFRFCPLNRRGGRWPRPPLVSRSTFGSLCAARNSPPGWRFPPVPQNLCRSTTSQALRAAKGRKKRGSFHPHRFCTSHPGPQGHHPPAAHLFAPLRQGFAPCVPKPAIKPYQQRSQSP